MVSFAVLFFNTQKKLLLRQIKHTRTHTSPGLPTTTVGLHKMQTNFNGKRFVKTTTATTATKITVHIV